jgi:hypothetical protein
VESANGILRFIWGAKLHYSAASAPAVAPEVHVCAANVANGSKVVFEGLPGHAEGQVLNDECASRISAAHLSTAAGATTKTTSSGIAITCGLFTGKIYANSAAIDFLTISAFFGSASNLVVLESNEAETFRSASVTVHSNESVDNRTIFSKCIVQRVFVGVEGKVPNVKFDCALAAACPARRWSALSAGRAAGTGSSRARRFIGG